MEVNDPVSTIMSRTVVVANQFHNFSEVLELFSKHNMHHLPVVDGKGNVIGIISSNDLMKLFYDPKYKDMKFNSEEIDKSMNITDIMTKDPVTVAPTESIRKVAKTFYDSKIQCLPVVDNGTLVGITTVKDLAQLVAYYG
ncbi:MAG: CBS domain-containing protein [Bacteroidetes bacterium]|nr:CBS domain-containing protein [Bacteroidota bacterium]MBS1684038.1 CBS domain-containing protein [Bacteroidota bacterium]